MKTRARASSIMDSLPSELSQAVFEEIRDIVYRHSGIALGDKKQSLVKARIQKRMRELDIETYEEYVEIVRSDKKGEELQLLLDAISTNTTSFYREKHHFEFMRALIAEWGAAGREKLRVWSSASSTGEEPYTIAIEILESLGNRRWDVKILATDIATKVLRQVQAGVYSKQAVEPIPQGLRQKYLSPAPGPAGERFTVSSKLKELVHVRQFNLINFPYAVAGPMDIVFCRNVMIYFDRPTRAEIVKEFSRIVRPGGFLFVGHSESLSGMTDSFVLVKPSIYRRG